MTHKFLLFGKKQKIISLMLGSSKLTRETFNLKSESLTGTSSNS